MQMGAVDDGTVSNSSGYYAAVKGIERYPERPDLEITLDSPVRLDGMWTLNLERIRPSSRASGQWAVSISYL